MFELTDQPIVPPQLECPTSGGFVSFEGRVRDHANGRTVTRLEYQAYPELAVQEGISLAAEATARFDLHALHIIHRTGVLAVGEMAVWIGVGAAHRREAFAGCEWIIDQLKIRVPIWKKETFEDGDSGWVGADVTIPNAELAEALTVRQRALPEVGAVGQMRLREARVLLVGVGGLGAGCLPYLAAAGIGTLGLIDADVVDATNLHRQVIYQASDVGRSKVERAASFAQKLNPTIAVHAHALRLDESNAEILVGGYDWIVDGTDSLATKFILNRICRKLGKRLVTASVHRFEGQLMAVAPDGPCLQCMFPTIPPERCVGTCAETGILGVVPGLLGVLQANEVLKWILGYGKPLTDHLLLVDLRTGQTERFARPHSLLCPVCTGCAPNSEENYEMSSLEDAFRRLGSFALIDVRDLDEKPDLDVEHQRIPLEDLDAIPLEGPVVFVCSTGTRSLQAAFRARSKGHRHAYSLRGGLSALRGAASC